MEKAVAVEIELKECGHSVARGDDELCVFVGAGDIHTVSQKAERVHDHVLRVPRKTQVEVPWQDLFLHIEEILHQFGQQYTLPNATICYNGYEPIKLAKEGRVAIVHAALEARTVLTCLCLYRRRQATMWVDMIADDLQAAIGNIKGSDQIDWKWKCFNWTENARDAHQSETVS